MRGNRRDTRSHQYRPGSIPACAGEPIQAGSAHVGRWVYPRVCGGTDVIHVRINTDPGLSPRVRGNLSRLAAPMWAGGSIPACAGEPDTMASGRMVSWVYPRVCGGTAARRRADDRLKGLFPRVRGNPPRPDYWLPCWRSIPACAGEPNIHHRRAFQGEVYPRVCGGTFSTAELDAFRAGLSPRVRGNLILEIPDPPQIGSIPACAGEPAAERPL